MAKVWQRSIVQPFTGGTWYCDLVNAGTMTASWHRCKPKLQRQRCPRLRCHMVTLLVDGVTPFGSRSQVRPAKTNFNTDLFKISRHCSDSAHHFINKPIILITEGNISRTTRHAAGIRRFQGCYEPKKPLPTNEEEQMAKVNRTGCTKPSSQPQ